MSLKIRLQSALKNALSFSLDARRISIMFSIMLITGFAIVFSIISFASYLPTDSIPFSKLAETVPNYAGNLLIISILLAAIVLLSAFLSILIKGAFIHNYTVRDSKEGIFKSIDALGGRIAPLVSLTVIIALVSIIFESIAFVGWFLSLFFSLAVFFAYQEVIIARKGAMSSIKGSFAILKESWKEVMISIFIVIVSSIFITGIFLIPFLAGLFSIIASVPAESLADPNLAPELLSALANNVLPLIILGAIAVIGISIANLFSNGFTTDVYLQLKGKKTESIKAAVIPKTESVSVMAQKPKKTLKRKPVKKKVRRKK